MYTRGGRVSLSSGGDFFSDSRTIDDAGRPALAGSGKELFTRSGTANCPANCNCRHALILQASPYNAGFHGLHPARLRRSDQLESRQFLLVADGHRAVYAGPYRDEDTG